MERYLAGELGKRHETAVFLIISLSELYYLGLY